MARTLSLYICSLRSIDRTATSPRVQEHPARHCARCCRYRFFLAVSPTSIGSRRQLRGRRAMRPQALLLLPFLLLAAASLHPLLCQGAAAASSYTVSVAAGKLAMDGFAADKGIDHFLVLAAVFVMCLFR
ncbi:hypothetical protein BS78_03G257500 [Paspalum vaginatum]|nr:hypothetical protein BS78_03G257500 [Paspalum vaginatum]